VELGQYSQFRPSILEIEAMLPAPKACAGRARSKRMAMVSSAVAVLNDGILVVKVIIYFLRRKEGKL
jgi:hypothetical protein